MKTFNRFSLALLASSLLLLTGCATNTSELTLDTSSVSNAANPQSQTTVYVRSSADKRHFEEAPRTPDIPSVMCETAEEQDHAIGRKRNGFGKALGKLILPPEQSVTGLTQSAIEAAFKENGVRVVNKDEVTADTKVIDVDVNKFWAWVEMGFWQITLSSDMSAGVRVNDAEDPAFTVEGSYHEGFQGAFESNWLTVLNTAYQTFCLDAKEKVKAFLGK